MCECVSSPGPLSPSRSTPPHRGTAPASFFLAGTAVVATGNWSSWGGLCSLGFVGGGEAEKRGSFSDVLFDGLVGGTCCFLGFFGSVSGDRVPSEAVKRLSFCPGAAPLGVGCECSVVFFGFSMDAVNRSPPSGSLVGGELNRSEEGSDLTGLAGFAAGLTGLLAGLVRVGAEKRSSTRGFAFFAEDVEEEENRSSLDPSSSNKPPSFSLVFGRALSTFVLVVVVVLLPFALSPDPVRWLLGAVAGDEFEGGAPNSSPSSGGGLGEPKRLSDRDLAATGGLSSFTTESELLAGLSAWRVCI